MATIQRSNTKVANRLINYAEKRAEVREGVNCPAEYAKSQMKATRALWGKSEGIQAHHIIQSFKPGEVTPEIANEIGRDLAKEVAKGHECVVYTHTDKDHIHNHIVINSVNYENGLKYNASKEELYRIREINDRLCKERDLSVVKEYSSPTRYTLAEKALLEKGEVSWKDEIRQVIDYEKEHSKTYEQFKQNLTEKYGIEVNERGKNITFSHPDNGRKVRGSKLGNSYEKEMLKNEFTREIEQTKGEPNQERGNTNLSGSEKQQREGAGIDRSVERNERSQRFDEGVHQNEHGQVSSREADLRQRDRQHQSDKQTSDRSNAFNIDEARKSLEQQRSNVAKGFNKFTQRDEAEQQPSTTRNENDKQSNKRATKRNQEHDKDRNGEHQQEKSQQLERTVSKNIEHGFER
ncbi:relaxase/mobilization nuclease domain-containing protein [Bacillus sp. V3B]|uniref:relaxase/mobilization nuclease domain-containing protein n=1 Tax=Bacillus sp. V3B TaxID=2804915 RepID=UPI00210EF18F|nr:relaxase/mobilization nuclease domain-containing protein [Bacillus sp. V3B]MCQ6277519.1 relaxase/mobilization nuclease domain-containing protein [Bacillus sp. V3B]